MKKNLKAVERFKPVPIRPMADGRIMFLLRCIVDLQLLTIYRFLQKELPQLQGRVLDLGAGLAPWRGLLTDAEYLGLDIESSEQFGMKRTVGVEYFDGTCIPFPDGSIDHVLCSEVLEHVPNASAFTAEMCRVLKKGGTLILTVPWSARVHHLPHDYRRLTPEGLREIFFDSGFEKIRIDERGSDLAVISNKTIVVLLRLFGPSARLHVLWCWPLALLLLPFVCALLLTAHLSLGFKLGSIQDPLGYAMVAHKK
jgi:SAM-dependent methyltransferase